MITGSLVLDLVLLVVFVSYAVSGYRQGVVYGGLSLGGFLGGVVLGLWLMPQVVTSLEPGRSRALLVVLGVVVLGGIGQAIGGGIGGRLRHGLRRSEGARVLDGVLGTVVSVVVVGLVLSVLATVVRGAPVPVVARAVGGSTVVRALDVVVPDTVSTAADGMAAAVSGDFPRVFAGIGPEQITEVAAPDAGELSAAAAVAQSGTVKVTGVAEDCLRAQEGSGFVVAPERVVTNAHVVAALEDAQVQPGGVGQRYDATVVHFDPDRDLAVLAVPGLPTAPMALGTDLASSAPALVVGYPGNGPFTETPARVRDVLVASGQDIYRQPGVVREVYSLYTQVRPGNSGGPVLDQAGAVVGVVFASSLDDPDTGYALTLAESRAVLDGAAGFASAVDTGGCTG